MLGGWADPSILVLFTNALIQKYFHFTLLNNVNFKHKFLLFSDITSKFYVAIMSNSFLLFQRWIFSTAFSPIDQWGFTEHPPMSTHLQTCPFYHRSRPETPHHLPSIKCGRHHGDNFQTVMKRMYPDFTPTASHHHPECNADLGLC